MGSLNATLDEYPEYNSKERGRIGVIRATRDRLVEIDPRKPSVQKRIEAYTWALEALKNEDLEIDQCLFYVLRDRRNYLETVPDEEMDGFLGRELRSLDWVMEELVEGSGHYVNRKKVVPWLVHNATGDFGSLDAAVVLAESGEEAVSIIRGTKAVRYSNDDLRQIYIADQQLVACEIKYRKGLVYHNTLGGA